MSGSARSAQLGYSVVSQIYNSRMGHQPCLGGKHVTVNIMDEKRMEAEGVSANSICIVLFSFFFGYKLSPEEGRMRYSKTYTQSRV